MPQPTGEPTAWAAHVRCPHGIEFWQPADSLGYFTPPKGCEHPAPRPVTQTATAGPWKTWRAMRKAKRDLRGW